MRSFITDLFYLKRLFPRRKFETNPFASFSVQERLRDWRHPAHPIVVEIHFIHADDAITRLVAIGLANGHVGAKPNDVSRAVNRFYDLGRVQTFLQLADSLIDSRELPLRIRIVAGVDQLGARDFNEPLQFVSQFLRALGRDVVFRARRERRRSRREIGNFRSLVLVARESLTHREGDGLGDESGNAKVDVGDGPGVPEAEGDGVGLGLGDGVGLGNGGILFSQ